MMHGKYVEVYPHHETYEVKMEMYGDAPSILIYSKPSFEFRLIWKRDDYYPVYAKADGSEFFFINVRVTGSPCDYMLLGMDGTIGYITIIEQ